MAGSGSDAREIDVEGRAKGQSVAALSDALTQALGALMQAGGAPAHLTAMTWAAPDPSAIHPSRRVVDYAWREVFAGFRPPLRLEASPGDDTIVRARARIPLAAPSDAPVFRGFSMGELARQMSPRAQVPDIGAMFDQWSRDGGAARARFGGLDIAYGAHRDEVLDLYRPVGARRAPVWVFIHGGYWQATTKDQYAQFCMPLVEAGFAVANIDYPLAPETPLREIVAHVRGALAFLVREANALGLDPAALHVAGHSAGGHLAAFMAADPLAPPLSSAHILSGVCDVESVFHIPMGRVLGLRDLDQARALSPVRMRPRAGTRIAVAVGGAESDEFRRQAVEIAQVWGAPAPLIAAGANHFSLLDGFLGGDLLRQALELCGAR
jgi:arylformamidase